VEFGRRRLSRAAFAVSTALIAGTIAATPVGATPAWSLSPNPGASGSASMHLHGVACAGPKLCLAVGDAAPSGAMERWNGNTWSLVASTNPTPRVLNAVACPSTTLCFAVGSTANGSHSKAWIERWNGKTRSFVKTPVLHGSTYSDLRAVTCANVKHCFAVGASGTKTFIVRWNGKAWSIIPSPNRVPGGYLYGVSCWGPTGCFAVGESGIKTLVERWDGKKWSIVASPNRDGADYSTFASVSCSSATSCFAVGNAGNRSFVERWNGKKWSIIASPNRAPTAAVVTTLLGVSCVSPTMCFAVGSSLHYPGTDERRVVQRWDGAHWSMVATPSPAGATETQFRGVACANVTNCFAVGTARGTDHDRALIARYA
jgi:hypothetical protein